MSLCGQSFIVSKNWSEACFTICSSWLFVKTRRRRRPSSSSPVFCSHAHLLMLSHLRNRKSASFHQEERKGENRSTESDGSPECIEDESVIAKCENRRRAACGLVVSIRVNLSLWVAFRHDQLRAVRMIHNPWDVCSSGEIRVFQLPSRKIGHTRILRRRENDSTRGRRSIRRFVLRSTNNCEGPRHSEPKVVVQILTSHGCVAVPVWVSFFCCMCLSCFSCFFSLDFLQFCKKKIYFGFVFF